MPERRQQPTILQHRNKFVDASIGNQSETQPDLERTIFNLRQASPLLANQIDQMIANRSFGGMGNQDKMWLFLHTQLTYTQKFKESGKGDDLYAPPGPPSAVTVSASELQSIQKEVKTFIEENHLDINDELEFGPSSMKRLTPTGR